MALEKLKTTEYGIDASYWKINKIILSIETNTIICILGLYAVSNANLSLLTEGISFEYDDRELGGDIRALCYTKTKLLSAFFADAQDI